MKPLNQILWDVDLAPSLLKGVETTDAPALDSKPAAPLDDQVGVAEPLPLNGPPREWVRDHGPTPQCGACNSSSRHGKKHSAGCCRRYRDWVQSQREAMAESVPKVSDRSEGVAHEPHKSKGSDSSESVHPTGRVRFTGKQPPVDVSGDRVPAPASLDAPTPGDDRLLESGDYMKSTLQANLQIPKMYTCQVVKILIQVRCRWTSRSFSNG